MSARFCVSLHIPHYPIGVQFIAVGFSGSNGFAVYSVNAAQLNVSLVSTIRASTSTPIANVFDSQDSGFGRRIVTVGKPLSA